MSNAHTTTARPIIATAGVFFPEMTRIIRRSVADENVLENLPTWHGDIEENRTTEDAADYIVCPQVSDGTEHLFHLGRGWEIEFSMTDTDRGLRFVERDDRDAIVSTGTIEGYARVTILD